METKQLSYRWRIRNTSRSSFTFSSFTGEPICGHQRGAGQVLHQILDLLHGSFPRLWVLSSGKEVTYIGSWDGDRLQWVELGQPPSLTVDGCIIMPDYNLAVHRVANNYYSTV